MARPVKKGLAFYYKDVHEWDQIPIMNLLMEYGTDGYCVYTLIESKVYENGYYLEIGMKSLVPYLMRVLGLRDREYVQQIIDYCAEEGLFDAALLKQSVITSKMIQRHYSDVSARSKADKSRYWLLDESETAENEESAEPVLSQDIIATETRVSAAKTPQRKENKKKENKSKMKAAESKAKKCVPRSEIPTANGEMPAAAAAADQAGEESEPASDQTPPPPIPEPYFAAEEAPIPEPYYPAEEAPIPASFAAEEVPIPEPYFPAEEAPIPEIVSSKITPSEAYSSVTGKRFKLKDKEALEEMREYGADEAQIVEVIESIGEREEESAQYINSMWYFLPIVREAVDRRAGRRKRRGRKGGAKERYAATSEAAEIEAILDAEWAAGMRVCEGREYVYNDG